MQRRFCWAVRVDWDRATRTEARDFSRWLQVAGKQSRPRWRAGPLAAVPAGARGGGAYAPSARAHSETVLRSFYDFHLDAGTGPVINRSRWTGPGGADGRTPITI